MKPQPAQHVLSHAKALPDKPQPLVKWLDDNGNALVGVACAVMIGGAIWFSYHRTTTSRTEAAWAQYGMARNAKEFGDIADVYEGYDVGAWARLSEGERYLDSGLALMFTDRTAGLGDLKKADEAFQKVLRSASAPTPVRERALWGLAKSIETQSDADTSDAIKAYETLLTEFPKSTYKASAEERIEALKSDSAKEFYAWFHKQKPKPPDRSKPQDGLPPGHPSIGTKDEPDDAEKPADGKKSTPPTLTIPLDPDDDEPGKKKKDDKPPSAEPEKSQDGQVSALIDRLKTEVEIDFNRTPLQEAFKFIADECEVEIGIDDEALKSAGFTKNMPQNLKLGKVTGLQAIAKILTRYEKESVPMVLVVDAAKKGLLITTPEFAKKDNLTPVELPQESDKPKDESEKPNDDANKPKGESKDPPAESK